MCQMGLFSDIEMTSKLIMEFLTNPNLVVCIFGSTYSPIRKFESFALVSFFYLLYALGSSVFWAA